MGLKRNLGQVISNFKLINLFRFFNILKDIHATITIPLFTVKFIPFPAIQAFFMKNMINHQIIAIVGHFFLNPHAQPPFISFVIDYEPMFLFVIKIHIKKIVSIGK
jgi:hypothetical protein